MIVTHWQCLPLFSVVSTTGIIWMLLPVHPFKRHLISQLFSFFKTSVVVTPQPWQKNWKVIFKVKNVNSHGLSAVEKARTKLAVATLFLSSFSKFPLFSFFSLAMIGCLSWLPRDVICMAWCLEKARVKLVVQQSNNLFLRKVADLHCFFH